MKLTIARDNWSLIDKSASLMTDGNPIDPPLVTSDKVLLILSCDAGNTVLAVFC